MGIGLDICVQCGKIDYDCNLCYHDDEDGGRRCERNHLNKSIEWVEKSFYVYENFINIRYLKSNHSTNELFDKIDWLIDNTEKEETDDFQTTVKYINSFSR